MNSRRRAAIARAITKAEHAALMTYARSHGRFWKAALRAAWANEDQVTGPGDLLQGLGVTHGRRWLERFALSRPVFITYPACQFRFEGGPLFDGVSLGTRWNGFDNVAVTGAVRAAIAAWLDPDEAADELRAIQTGPDGLISLADGWSAVIERPDGLT